jgi:hypothetical protein
VYPVPSWPVNIFPYIFGAYLLIGIVWIFSVHKRTPGYSADVQRRVYNDHGQLAPAEVSSMTPQQQAS